MAAKPTSTTKGFQDERYRKVIGVLVEERKRQGLSQLAVAERLGRHQQFVSRYELGERRLDVLEFLDVVRVLQLDALSLLSPYI